MNKEVYTIAGLSALLATGCSTTLGTKQGIANESERYINPVSVNGIKLQKYTAKPFIDSSHITREGETYFIEHDYLGLSASNLPIILKRAGDVSVKTGTENTAHLDSSTWFFARQAYDSLSNVVTGISFNTNSVNVKLVPSFNQSNTNQNGTLEYAVGNGVYAKLSRPIYQFRIDPDGEGTLPVRNFFAPSRKGGDLPFSFVPYSPSSLRFGNDGQFSINSGEVYEFKAMTSAEVQNYIDARKAVMDAEKVKSTNVQPTKPLILTPIAGDATSDIIQIR